MSELLVPGFGRPVLLCRGKMSRARGMAAYIRNGYRAFCQPKFECDCCEIPVFRFCGARQKNLYVFSLYPNPDLDDRIFYCLQASMAAVQNEDIRVSFLLVDDLNGHHQEWLGSTTTNRHGVAAFDFATVPGCDQLVVGQTHARGGTHDLLMTDVPDLVDVALVAPIPNQPHLLNKYQINMGFSHFHEFNWDLIWYVQIGTISNRYCERMWFLQWQYYINLILIFYQLSMLLEYENFTYLIFYFLHVFVGELIIISMFSVIHEILQNSNPFS